MNREIRSNITPMIGYYIIALFSVYVHGAEQITSFFVLSIICAFCSIFLMVDTTLIIKGYSNGK